MNKDKKLSKEDIQQYLEEIWKTKKPERKIVLHTFCETYGWVDRSSNSNDFKVCDDPNCGSCSLWNESVKEWTEKWNVKGPSGKVVFDSDLGEISIIDLGKPHLRELDKRIAKERKKNEEGTDNRS